MRFSAVNYHALRYRLMGGFEAPKTYNKKSSRGTPSRPVRRTACFLERYELDTAACITLERKPSIVRNRENDDLCQTSSYKWRVSGSCLDTYFCLIHQCYQLRIGYMLMGLYLWLSDLRADERVQKTILCRERAFVAFKKTLDCVQRYLHV